MAKRVAALYDRADKLRDDIIQTVPVQYFERSNPTDRLEAAWLTAFDSSMEAASTLWKLARILRRKAGITDESSP